MIDSEFKIYLIEANTNPCLESSSPFLGRLISEMIDNSFKYLLQNDRIAIDPLFPPPETYSTGLKCAIQSEVVHENRYHLVFNESNMSKY